MQQGLQAITKWNITHSPSTASNHLVHRSCWRCAATAVHQTVLAAQHSKQSSSDHGISFTDLGLTVLLQPQKG